MKSFKFTIFIPYYNRSHTIIRLLDSLEQQTFNNFECIIIDDGSNDNFSSEISNIKKRYSYKINYYYQKNGGKHRARNQAIKLSEGELFLTIDSDDIILPDTLNLLEKAWSSIPDKEKEEFAGVEGLLGKFDNPDIHLGKMFTESPMISNHIETRFIMDINGDKMRFIKTEIFKNYLFPEIEGENFITESIVWNKIGLKYKMLYLNEVIGLVDYQSNGISSNSAKVRAKNSKGAQLYYLEFLNTIVPNSKVKIKYILRNKSNYFRYSYHRNMNILNSIKKVESRKYTVLCLVLGYFLYKKDMMEINS